MEWNYNSQLELLKMRGMLNQDILRLTISQRMIMIGLNLLLMRNLVELKLHMKLLRTQMPRQLLTSKQILWTNLTSLSSQDLLFQMTLAISTIQLILVLVNHARMMMPLFKWTRNLSLLTIQIRLERPVKRRSEEEKLYWDNNQEKTQMAILVSISEWMASHLALHRKKKTPIRRMMIQMVI